MSYLDEVHARATIQARYCTDCTDVHAPDGNCPVVPPGSKYDLTDRHDTRYHRVPRRYRALLVPAIAALMILGIEVAADRVEDSYQDYEPDRYGEVSP